MSFYKKFHFYSLAILTINFIIRLIYGISLSQNVLFFVKALLVITGILLFFNKLASLKSRIYYSYYVLFSGIITFSMLYNSSFYTMLSQILYYPLFGKTLAYNDNHIVIYRDDFIYKRCCTYDFYKSYYGVIENKLISKTFDSPIHENDVFKIQNNSIYYHNSTHVYNDSLDLFQPNSTFKPL